MSKKRKTLPKNFDELIEAGDLDSLKAVFEKCEINATFGYNKSPVLSSYGMPEELTRWLVLQGADINATDHTYQRTALHRHATLRNGNINLLLELGANVEVFDTSGDTPLHMAAGSAFNPEMVQALVQKGANIFVKNNRGETPLESALRRANNIDIVNLVSVVEILLKAGAKTSAEMSDFVTKIGENFEFHREGFNKENIVEIDAALIKLYAIFSTNPVEKRIVNDGISPIVVKQSQWQDQYEQLWILLVPSSGSAATIQGEVIRITGRVRDEIHRNGGMNWDDNYKKMLDALIAHLGSLQALSDDLLVEAKNLAQHIKRSGRSGNIDHEPNRLCELAVKWVIANPNPVQLAKPEYDR